MAASNLHQECFSLKQSALFVQAAKSRNQQALAQALFMSQASVSRTLLNLEKALKAPLFDRDHGVSKLTAAGEIFLQHAQRIFQCQVEMLQVAVDTQEDEKAPVLKASRINFAQIKALLAVSAVGSFSSAARAAGTSQSSLSCYVKDLEDALGAVLIQRTATGIQMTQAGNSVLPLAVQLHTLYVEACSAMALWREKNLSKLEIMGSLAVMPFITPSLLQLLKAEYPHHQIELKGELSDRVEQSVFKGEASFGLCAVTREKPQFVYTHLLQVQLGVIWSPELPFPETINCLDDLAHVPLVRFSDQALISEALADAQCNFGAYANSRLTVGGIDPGLDFVQSGKFAMLITGIGAERQLARGLRFLPLPNLLPSIRVSIIRKRDRIFDERQQHLSDTLAQCVTSLPWHSSIKVMRQMHK